MNDNRIESDSDDVPTLARALAERVRWEMETCATGFRAPTWKPDEARASEPSPVLAPAPASADVPASASIPSFVDPAEALEGLRQKIGDCTRCELHIKRTNLVFGDGTPKARLVFVGEGPGRDEDLSGVPFVGAAGQLLNKIITAIGLTRQQVYICNVVKCRPPGNRDPKPVESSTCGPFMRRQIEIIRPTVVVALGRPAAHFLLKTDASMGALRGRFHDMDGIPVMPTYHPAYLLRNESAKRPVWEDMKKVRDLLGPGEPTV